MSVTDSNHPLVSVVVPIYNVEKYIGQCVDSLLNQDFENFELILVDDGSPDSCGEIIDEYSRKDDRIRVLHKENGGLSDARNAGVNIATAEYIIFVDSDDYVDSDYISELWRLHDKYGTDMCFTAAVKESDEGNALSKKLDYVEGAISSSDAQAMILNGEVIGTSACGKLITKSLCIKYPFPKGKLMEDLRTVFFMLNDVEKTGISTKQTYHYIQHEGSILHDRYGIDEAREYLDLGKMFVDIAGSRKILNASYARLLYIASIVVRGASEKSRKEIYSLVRNNIRPNLKYILCQRDISFPKKIRAIIYSAPDFIMKRLSKI